MSDIVLKSVNFAYERDMVLEDINFSLTCKDFLAIIGPNGGGKSTLLKLILGLLKPISGKISVFDKDPRDNNSILAYVPQNTNAHQIFPITCLEVVLMGRLNGKCMGFYTKDDYKRAYSELERVGIRDLADENINSISGGQRQRTFIARALCSDAKILVLDEPTASIDTNGQIQIYGLLKELNDKLGIIVVSHDINISVNFANQVAHVNRTLYMHDTCDNRAKQETLVDIQNTHNHLCSIEVINQIACQNPDCPDK